MQEMFCRSPSPVGLQHFGIKTVTNSCFQIVGHTWERVIWLYMSASDMARRVANLSIRAGKISP